MNDINILMVDDNEDDYLLVSQYLKRSQYYSYNVIVLEHCAHFVYIEPVGKYGGLNPDLTILRA